MPDDTWHEEAIFMLDAVRSVHIERSRLGARRAILGGEWSALEGRGSMPLLAAKDLADELDRLVRKLRLHIALGVPQ